MRHAISREARRLGGRYALVASGVGTVLLLAAGWMLVPVLAVFADPSPARAVVAFVAPAAAMALLGQTLRRGRRIATANLSLQEGGVIIVVSWLVVIVFSAVPFAWITGLPWSRALFESVSGWTTTGLSVVDVTTAGAAILLWRSAMQLAGGAGLAIVMMSALVGPTGVGLTTAEGRSDQLVPNVRRSAQLVLVIYACYTVIGTIAYRVAGMTFFDALNHAFCAVSTGGFSTRPTSIGAWDSVAVEAVTIVLMLLGNLSFVTAWLLWRGRVRTALRSREIHLLAVILPAAAAALLLGTTHQLYPELGKAVRVAVFETVSALTTSGYSTVGYLAWSPFGVAVLIALMTIGGGVCSTAGGLKQLRAYLLWKVAAWEIRRALLPQRAVMERPWWDGQRTQYVDDEALRRTLAFVWLYLTALALGTLVLCASGFGLAESLFEFASALGTVGLSVGVTSPSMPDVALWAETAAMFLGRLEVVVVFVSLVKLVRDGRVALLAGGGRGVLRPVPTQVRVTAPKEETG